MTDDQRRCGVLLVGHGTRDAAGTEQFFQLGRLLEKELAPLPVIACLLEFQEPTIPQAWERLVAAGVQHVHVSPLLLFAAGHAKQDIPDLVRECQSKTPQVTFDQAGPLSRHGAIVDLLRHRIRSASASLDSQSTALVMVGRGSHDPCAQADMRCLSELIAHREPFASVTTAFYAMAKPRLPEILDQAAANPNVRDVVVQPHLLFEGRLYQAIEKQVAEASERHPDVKFHLGDYLGPNQQVAQAIKDRVAL
ncbi:sirohydrochlorin chelatase [Stieleria marina]|uniref:Sirohydrochlorin cobaltochelatase n=1 Tax=Stieleria marina TaxID=1930275 RepID=A0A517NLZ1_9BACT|nr:Sirohydrochlorin cobaltochelatase [Planctomycetes bacterium K23_9]